MGHFRMGDDKNPDADLDIFEQLDEALEERLGSERRKQDSGNAEAEENRRKSDRRDK